MTADHESHPAKGLAHWRDRLAGTPPALELATSRPRGADRVWTPATSTGDVCPKRTGRITALAAARDAKPDEAGIALVAAFLLRTTGQRDLCLGVDDGGVRRPLRLDLAGQPSFLDLLDRVDEELAAAREEGDVPLADILVDLGIDAPDLFQVAVGSTGAEGTDLAFDVDLARGDVSLVYNAALFDEQATARMQGHLSTLVDGIIATPDAPVGTLPFLTAEEREQILVTWNDKTVPFPLDATLHGLFEERAAAQPDAIAAVHRGTKLTYRELNERANRIAHHLRGLGVGPEVLVGISCERSFEMVVGLLGILKAGGAYLPMDPAYPRERLKFMLEDSRVSVVLAQEHLAPALPVTGARIVLLDAIPEILEACPTTNPDSAARAESLCYVIYTSGSTGAPKGVVLNHRGRVNNFLDFNRRFDVGEGDALIALASLSFDMCAYDVFGVLAAGATIVLPRPSEMQNPGDWARLMREERVTIWHTAPAMLKMLVDHLEAQPAATPRDLRLTLLGGDWIPVTLPDRLRTRVDDVRFISMGGATECSMDSTIYEVREVDPAWKSIPYGEPMANQLAYVLDENLQPTAVGTPGELYLGGIGVGRGYFERPELTAERFLPNPFPSPVEEDENPRIYRTGDLARWMPDGNLELLGRMDNQVKIRGYRIELGEIEARLCQHPGVQEGVVITRDDAAGEKRLVAYVVQDPAWTGPDEAEPDPGAEQVAQWQAVYDNAYRESAADQVEDPTFNIVSWNSSYTNQPLPAEEMRVWVDQTVERIRRHDPDRVLEIGCGMGLLLFRIAPSCSFYLGTDFSQVALDYVGQHRARLGLDQVELGKRWADDFDGIADDSLDAIVLNSIVLDFPDMDYLMEVLRGSVRAVRPGGTIFVGDVRSRPLIEAYQTSVQLFQAADDATASDVRARVQRLIRQEEELVIDPRFFEWLATQLPEIGAVRIELKRGDFTNELNAYRYDVTLHVGDSSAAPADKAAIIDGRSLDLAGLRDALMSRTDDRVVVHDLPNDRVARDVQAVELLRRVDDQMTVRELRDAIENDAAPGLAPEDVWSLAKELGLACDLRWSVPATEGRFDAIFGDADTAHPVDASLTAADFANRPMLGKLSRQLGPDVKRFLAARLPEYMVPTVYVPLDALPLSPNKKVDRKALPAPDTSRPAVEAAYAPPGTPTEEVVADVWIDVLGLDRVGVDDAFLDLGGHSLLAVQVQARLAEIFPFEIPLPAIFETRTIARLSRHLEELGSRHRTDVVEICRMLRMIDELSEEEIAARIENGARP